MCSRTAYKDFFSKDMDLEDFKKLLPHFPEVEAVVLEGWGESLLHKDLVECIGLVKEKGPRVGFVNSGKGLDESVISELLKNIGSLATIQDLSIHGSRVLWLPIGYGQPIRRGKNLPSVLRLRQAEDDPPLQEFNREKRSETRRFYRR